MGTCCAKGKPKARHVNRCAKPYPTVSSATAPSVASRTISPMNERYHVAPPTKPVNVLAKKAEPRQEQPSIICKEEEDSVEVVLPQKFVDRREKPDCVPMLRIGGKDDREVETDVRSLALAPSGESLQQFPGSSCKSPTFGESPDSSSSLSEVISEVSLVASQQLQSPTTSTTLPKQVQFLSPLKRSAGKPTLLRPLQEKREQLGKAKQPQAMHSRFPSEASTVKFSLDTDWATQVRKAPVKFVESIDREERENGEFVLNGYCVTGKENLTSALKGVCYRATQGDAHFLVYEYRKRDLRRLLFKKKQTALDALQQQIDVLSQCAHPHIIPLAAVLEAPQRDPIYIVLQSEFASGLTALVPLQEREAWDVFRQMLSAVEYLHTSLRLTHSDLRPSSFLVDSAGEVKLCWVGSCSKQTDESEQGKDLFSLVAVLFLLLFSKSGDEDDYFDELLGILRTEKIAIPHSCSPQLRSFLTMALEQRDNLSAEDFRNNPWVQDGL